MKPFGQWLNDFKPTKKVEDTVEIVLENAPTFSSQYMNPPITAECCVCGREIDLASYGIAPEDVDEDAEFYCGGSPRCCP